MDMDKIHISIIGIHITLVGGLLMIEAQLKGLEQNNMPFLTIITGLFPTLLTLLSYLFPSSDMAD